MPHAEAQRPPRHLAPPQRLPRHPAPPLAGRVARRVPAALAGLAVITVVYFWWGRLGEASGAVWLGSAILIGGATAGAVIGPTRARAHASIAALLLLTVGAFAATRAIGRWPFAWDSLADPRYAALIAVLTCATAVGLLRGKLWAGWAALGFAGASGLGGVLNSIQLGATRDEVAWLAAIGVVGALVIASQLARPAVRAHLARDAADAVWASRDRLVRSARWAAIAAFAAAPMLVLYALGQPVAPATVPSALVLAAVLALGAVLVFARRGAGVVVLGAGGLGLLAHTAATGYLVPAPTANIAGYYTAFWLPAAVLGISACIAALRAPVDRPPGATGTPD